MVISSYRCNSLGIPKDVNTSTTVNDAVAQLRLFLANSTDTEFHCKVIRDSVDEPVGSNGCYPSMTCTATCCTDRDVAEDDTVRCSVSRSSRVNTVDYTCSHQDKVVRDIPFAESFER